MTEFIPDYEIVQTFCDTYREESNCAKLSSLSPLFLSPSFSLLSPLFSLFPSLFFLDLSLFSLSSLSLLCLSSPSLLSLLSLPPLSPLSLLLYRMSQRRTQEEEDMRVAMQHQTDGLSERDVQRLKQMQLKTQRQPG